MSNYDDKFILAIQLQDHKIIKSLIEKIDVNLRNGSALNIASNLGDYVTVQILVEAGIEIDKTKALTLASQRGHTKIVDLLIKSGATKIDEALKSAAKKNSKNTFWLLLNNTRVESQFYRLSQKTKLMETIKEILVCSDESYSSALMSLITDDDIEAIEEITKTDLLERLIDFNSRYENELSINPLKSVISPYNALRTLRPPTPYDYKF